jgi:hypothetical protein
MILQTIAIHRHCSTHIFADKERFELSTGGLTNRCSAVELFVLKKSCERIELSFFALQADASAIPPARHLFVGPVRLERTTLPMQSGCISAIELRTNL